MVEFEIVQPEDFDRYADKLFAILHGNMTTIAPTGNPYAKDYQEWKSAVAASMNMPGQVMVVIVVDGVVGGFFRYVLRLNIFLMEELQLAPQHHGVRGIFRGLYSYVLPQLPPHITAVEAYADKANKKSIAVLQQLGLKITGENPSGRSYRLQGSFQALVDWLHKSPHSQ